MSSIRVAERTGAQEPRVRVANGSVAYSDGDDCCALASEVGLEFFPWESSIIHDWCSRDEQDRPSYVTAGLGVPRQNGKNAVLEGFELYVLAVCGWHVLHTAHRVKTAKKSFYRLVRYFTDKRHPEIVALVANIRYTNGEEAIYLTNGGSIEFSARSRAGNRGFDDIQLVVFDEAQDLTDEQLNAILFTLAASSTGERMMVFTGTPPDEDAPGEVFARNREVALTRDPKRTCWHEWGITELPKPDATFDDVLDLVYETNPSMGYVLDEEFTEDEFNKADLLGFCVERLGYWIPKATATALITPEQWSRSSVSVEDAPRPSTGDRVAYGVKFSPDGSSVAISACVRPEDGTPHVELVRCEPLSSGVGWLAGFLVERADTAAAIAIDGLNGANALIERIKPDVPRRALNTPGTQGVVAASDMFYQAICDGLLTHLDKGQDRLDQSALTSAKRQVGSSGGWSFGGDDPAPVESACLAYWAVMTTKRNPGRGCVML